jgi:aryl-alcohol dehydrogenase-like predicted oxidoreductase
VVENPGADYGAPMAPLLPLRPFGKTGLTVSALGLGAGHLGGGEMDDASAAALLGAALDAGVTLIDTARSYGRSEARIGRALAGRRDGVVIATKGGYGIEGVPDWTAACIAAGVDAALGVLRTDRVDVFLLHSCPLATLVRGEVIDALERAVRAGKVRVMGYSGEGEALAWAVRSGRFGAVETSVSLCDQRVIDEVLPAAAAAGMGVIAKRPLANAPWRFAARQAGHYAETYWERLLAMAIDPGALPWDELAVRFAAFQPGVSTAIVGTAQAGHLQRAAAGVAAGPLPEAQVEALREAFRRNDRDWVGQV